MLFTLSGTRRSEAVSLTERETAVLGKSSLHGDMIVQVLFTRSIR